jgi:spore photoproduct lyase
MTVDLVERKSMTIRYSGRSSDYISPSFGFGCLYNCGYCYVKRHTPESLTIAQNHDKILNAIAKHVATADIKKPNQTHPEFITYDISCNEDFALHAKRHKWEEIFDFFKHHDKAMATLATKYIPELFLNYNPEGKVRIRFSLMPQIISNILEPNTTKISDRIKAIDKFIDAGYDVHVNFSPIVVFDNWLIEYLELFAEVDRVVKNKNVVRAECIFLTHNQKRHDYNIERGLTEVEELLWIPDKQETKTSSYGGKNLRYQIPLKKEYVNMFKYVHGEVIPWNKIRYIF